MISTTVLQSLRRRIRRWLPRRSAELTYRADGWNVAARQPIKGWNVASVPAAQLNHFESWRETALSTRPLASDLTAHNTLLTFAYAAALAATGGRLSLLDWGGGIGQYEILARGVLPGIAVEYHCKEVAAQCVAGRKVLANAFFYESEHEFAGRHFDLVLASGSLQYSQDWRATLAVLAAATGRLLLVTRLPVVREAASYVVLQRAQRYGYDTEYLGWRLNRDEFLMAASRVGLTLVREFVLGEEEWAGGAPEPARASGFLFQPAATGR